MNMTLREALDKLPDTVEGIVELMNREGIVGKTGHMVCPLAIWFKRLTGEEVSVTPGACRFIDSRDYVTLPRAAMDFIEQFDTNQLDRALYATARTGRPL